MGDVWRRLVRSFGEFILGRIVADHFPDAAHVMAQAHEQEGEDDGPADHNSAHQDIQNGYESIHRFKSSQVRSQPELSDAVIANARISRSCQREGVWA
jgi:hypothetical protein